MLSHGSQSLYAVCVCVCVVVVVVAVAVSVSVGCREQLPPGACARQLAATRARAIPSFSKTNKTCA